MKSLNFSNGLMYSKYDDEVFKLNNLQKQEKLLKKTYEKETEESKIKLVSKNTFFRSKKVKNIKYISNSIPRGSKLFSDFFESLNENIIMFKEKNVILFNPPWKGRVMVEQNNSLLKDIKFKHLSSFKDKYHCNSCY